MILTTLLILIMHFFYFYGNLPFRDLLSFPTRRSSDLSLARSGNRSVTYCKFPEACSSLWPQAARSRSEEHTSELQSRGHLVCRLLLEKKINLFIGNILTIHLSLSMILLHNFSNLMFLG